MTVCPGCAAGDHPGVPHCAHCGAITTPGGGHPPPYCPPVAAESTDGFGRPACLSLVHADGHAAVVATAGVTAEYVRSMHRLLTAAGVGQRWKVAKLALDDAVAAYLAGMDCQRCVIRLRCGCHPADVLAGRCAHGTARRLRRTARRQG